ncbi:FAD dependent oxidoreductase [Collybia nuda]|uniref:FAD dependent oxidoreductase n=1 Tax=Collybia nuda TaxID=64659 RepID=A0A9P5YJQ0_9AGAR|nr:FAD dependent oxidoreductase [Collybia nuda]
MLSHKIVIVGAGCFGVSTAYHLLKRGFTGVTILDRSSTIPALDAASNDINRIVRSSYSDPFYAKLAREAIAMWKDKEEWGNTYQESGVVVLGSSEKGISYVTESHRNDAGLGASLQWFPNSSSIQAIFPPEARTASFDQQKGYINYDGGWANASQGLSMMISKVTALNGKILPSKCVTTLLRQNGKTIGVECTDGSIYTASLIVLAIGSWTPSSFPILDLGLRCLATGQCIATLQLTDDEMRRYRKCPVVLDFSTGFYIFPPNEQGIVKMATHVPGYTHTIDNISTPRTVTTDPHQGLSIPKSDIQSMRRYLKGVYPDLAGKPFSGTRLCWYNDSIDGDWVIDRYKTDPGLMLATAGSGHAFKFLPVIGRLVADIIQGASDPSVVSKFALERNMSRLDSSRCGTPTELNLGDLCTPEDLTGDV